MACWAATAIREAFPDSRLVWAVEERCAHVIPASLATVEAFPRPRRRGLLSPAAWVGQYRRYTRLREYRFDAGIDLHGHLKTALCLRLARPARRWAFRATDALTARLNPQVRLKAMPDHEIDRQMAMLRTLGRFVTPERPQGFPRSVPEVPRLATLMTGASHPAKAIGVGQIRDVAVGLLALGYRVEMLGGPGDPTPDVEGAENFVGRYDVAGTLGRIAASAVHVAPDTWTGHAAAACGVPVVSLFGEGKNRPERYRPYAASARVLQAARACDVPAESIVEAARQIALRQTEH
jgi:ADP-heptose:LPS heptosyltransferase